MTPSRRDYLQFADYLHDHGQRVPEPLRTMVSREPLVLLERDDDASKGWWNGLLFGAALWGILGLIWLAWHYAR